MRPFLMVLCFAAGLLAGRIALPEADAAVLPSLLQTVSGFTADHHKDKTKQISYVPLEGGEETTYWRGTVKLEYGKARVEHPQHFALVSNEKGLSVLVTPTAACKVPVMVSKLNLDAFELVQQEGEKNTCEVYFMVQGVRRGHEKYDPVQKRH